MPAKTRANIVSGAVVALHDRGGDATGTARSKTAREPFEDDATADGGRTAEARGPKNGTKTPRHWIVTGSKGVIPVSVWFEPVENLGVRVSTGSNQTDAGLGT